MRPGAGGGNTLYGIERALFGIRWADSDWERERERERERTRRGEAIKSAQIRYSTTLIGRDSRGGAGLLALSLSLSLSLSFSLPRSLQLRE